MANLQNRALKSLTHKVELNKSQINSLLLQLRALSPQSTLERGYAIVENQAGAVIKSKTEVKTGETLRVIFAKDEIQATVTTSKDQKE
jgi:exodeoxyribonuclease VII large subunit